MFCACWRLRRLEPLRFSIKPLTLSFTLANWCLAFFVFTRKCFALHQSQVSSTLPRLDLKRVDA